MPLSTSNTAFQKETNKQNMKFWIPEYTSLHLPVKCIHWASHCASVQNKSHSFINLLTD